MRQVLAAMTHARLTGGGLDPRIARKQAHAPGLWKRMLSPGSSRRRR
jgi:hypothetical protein